MKTHSLLTGKDFTQRRKGAKGTKYSRFAIRCLLCAVGFILSACDTPTVSSPVSVLPSPTATLTFTPTTTPTSTPTPTPTATATPTLIPTSTQTPPPTPVPTTTLEWECWNEGPGSECRADKSLSLKQMTFTAENEAWAVGDGGYIARWDGQRWTRVASPTDKSLNAVAFIAPDDGWIAGDGGQLLHWDGNVWSVVREYQPAASGSGNILLWYALEFSGRDDGWVAGCVSSEGGSEAQIMHWNGTDWQDTPTAPQMSVYCYAAITMITSQDIWMAGGHGEGIIAYWDGEVWQKTFDSDACWLFAVDAIAPDDVWAAGLQATPTGHVGKVLRWNGMEWLDVGLPSTQWVNAILMASEDNGWVGGDALFHWNGDGWERANQSIVEWGNVIDIEESSGGEIWALTEYGVFFHLRDME